MQGHGTKGLVHKGGSVCDGNIIVDAVHPEMVQTDVTCHNADQIVEKHGTKYQHLAPQLSFDNQDTLHILQEPTKCKSVPTNKCTT